MVQNARRRVAPRTQKVTVCVRARARVCVCARVPEVECGREGNQTLPVLYLVVK